MTVRHHVSDALLVAHAAGTLSVGWSIAIASHVALCPACRRRVGQAEAVGAALLDAAEPAAVAPGSLDTVLRRLRAPGAASNEALNRELASSLPFLAAVDAPPLDPALAMFPPPLRRYLGPAGPAWRKLGTTAHHMLVPTGDRQTKVRLLKIGAGTPVPTHGHRGLELTLVLSGSFRDGEVLFGRGDIEEADESVEHQPVATPEADCICLAVTDAPLRFKSLIGKLLQPFLRI